MDLIDVETAFAALIVPGPTVTALTAPFWEAAADGRLTMQHCPACGTNILYPRRICPSCWHDELEWREASGRGQVRSFTRIHCPGHPGWVSVAPYVVGIVTLDEGPCLLTLILEAKGEARVGAPVIFEPTKIGARVVPVFGIAP